MNRKRSNICELKNWILPIALALIFSYAACGQSRTKAKPSELFALGEKALDERAYKTALAHYNECLRLDPFFWDAYYGRALSRERLGDAKGALTDYNIFLESKPEQVEALFSRAVLRYNNGQWALAGEDFSLLLRKPGGTTNMVFHQTNTSGGNTKVMTLQGNRRADYLNYLGLIDWRLKKYQQAIVYLDSALQLLPNMADFWVNRGIVKQSLRDTLAAVKDFKSALQIDPEHALANHNLALLGGLDGKEKETEKLITEAIEKNPNLIYSYEERGFLRMKARNWKGALADFNQAILLDANDPDNWLQRGIVKEKLKDMSGALADYSQAIKLKDDYERAWMNRGNLLSKMNRLGEAIEDYTIAITHYPEYGLAYYNRARAFHKTSQLKKACADLLQAQKFNVPIDRKVEAAICK
ncbi:MAG: tetratricopeptide repeat protein [Cyclobacteriaceae bacterium]